MTNREYFGNNKISFNDAMKEFNTAKFKSFDDFLNSERTPNHKFKVGDIIVMDCNNDWAARNNWKHNVVFCVQDIVTKFCKTNYYRLKFLTPCDEMEIGLVRDDFTFKFIDEVCSLY